MLYEVITAAAAQCDELGGIAPVGHAADAGQRQAGGLLVTRDLGHHAQRDGFHRRATVAAVRAFTGHGWQRREMVQVDADNGIDGVSYNFV